MFGYFCALGSALTWSIAVIIFKKAGDSIHPTLMNLVKNVIGFVLLLITLYVVEGSFTLEIDRSTLVILLISGALGVGIADALFLKSLHLIGASRAAIVECMYSPFVIFLSIAYLSEELTVARFVGALLVISALLLVAIKGRGRQTQPKNMVLGVVLGVIAMFAMASGIVFIKPFFDTVPLLWVINIRMASGVVVSFLIVNSFKNRKEMYQGLIKAPGKILFIIGCIFGAYISMMMWVAGFKYLEASEAGILNQTATIFTVILAAMVLKEKITYRIILGTVLAVIGVVVVTTF